MDITLRMSDHALTARAAAAAGIVLLQNKNRTLPLLPQEDGAPLPVAVFGVKQLQTPAFDKTMAPWRSIGVLDGLAASETVRPDALLARKYRTWAVEHPEGSEMPLTNLDFGALRHDCAAAVVVIGRTPERYGLRLTNEETAMLTRVTSVFDRTVLVLAAPGFIELNEAALSCGAIVFLGLAGQEAGGALADVLTAKVMPSGHLSFSWPECAEAFADACAAADQFTGYRYFDSFGVPVRYPFGHGLSYGTVAFGSVSAGLDGCDVTVSAELVNTGEEFAASELVQVYVTRPEGDLTRPVSFLNCFRKSRLLAPGESQTITLRFPITELSVYRESAHAFVLDAGYYDIRIGTSSRACYLAGSIRLTRSAVVQAAEPLTMPAAQERRRPEIVCFQFPEDLAEIEQAHKHAIRFSDRDLPRRSRRRGREFTGCRPDGEHHTLADVREGRCSVFHLVADMDTENLERLVCGFGREEASVPGALGASAAIERYGIPAVQIAGGAQGLRLLRDIPDEETGEIVRRQCATVFPAPAQLACSFDQEVVRAVGRAVGLEMAELGVQLWLGPDAGVMRSPQETRFAEKWSEDPVVCGTMTAALAGGAWPYGTAVLHAQSLPETVSVSQSALRDVYGLPFEIAANSCRAAKLPDCAISGQRLTENSPLLRAWLLDCGYGGMLWGDETPGSDRIGLEKAAIRILKWMLQAKKL